MPSRQTRTYLIIDRTMRYVQNMMAARRPFQLDPMQSIPIVLTSRTTQRRRVRSRSEEQVPLACQWMRPRSEMQRTAKARSIAHFCGRIPKGPLLRAPVRGVTHRDGGCDSVREALVREQTHKPRFKVVFAALAPLPAPLFESPSPGRSFRPRRCCSLLVWTGQMASLAPSRKRKSLPSHARAIMR